MKNKLKVLELFAGIGACSKALERLKIDHEIVDAVEIDKFAIKSFNAIHGTDFEPQDITKWDKDIECDLIMHGSPCQDFSVAGKQAGGDKNSGTRSSLMYETIRIVEKLKPKYVIWENVKNILSEKHRPNFENYCRKMKELGYKNFAQVLNAKDYGIPQNRERVFTISILRTTEDKDPTFSFPKIKELASKLRDFLETDVDEKYYITDAVSLTHGALFDKINGGKIGKMHDISRRAYHIDGIAPTIHTAGGGNTEPKIVASRGRGADNKQHLEPRKDGLTNTLTSVQKDNYVIVASTQKHASCRTDGVSPTLLAAMGLGGGQTPMHNYNGRIRKLTPKECWRLMGFDDVDFEKASKVCSNTQLYKQAGNSIVVNVLEAILKELL